MSLSSEVNRYLTGSKKALVRGLVVDDGIKMDGLIQRRELPWGDEQGRWLKNGVDC